MISQVRSVLHSTTCFTRQYCMLVCSFYCFLKTSSFHSLTKVCPVQTFPHNQITSELWLCVLECGNCHLNLFWMLGKHRQVWQVCVCAIARVTYMHRLKRIVVIWQNQCLGIARKGVDTRSWKQQACNNKLHNAHSNTSVSVRLIRQMWIFCIQLCSDNTPNMLNKRNKGQTQQSTHVTHQHWWVWSTSVVNTSLPVTILI